MKIFVAILALTSFLLVAEAVNYKRDYCGNREFVGNRKNKYPHLHCGRKFLTLSRSNCQHDNLHGRCNKVNEILGSPDRFYGKARKPCEITAVLKKYKKAGCLTAVNVLLQVLQN